jgi:hypothetical protein
MKINALKGSILGEIQHIMVAMNPPNLGSLVQIGQFFVQWPLSLNIAQQDDGVGWLFLAKVDDVVKLPVHVTAEVNVWFVFHSFLHFKSQSTSPD